MNKNQTHKTIAKAKDLPTTKNPVGGALKSPGTKPAEPVSTIRPAEPVS